jgi:glycine cleavage system H protein
LSDTTIPTELRYSREDEWARREGNRLVVGVTDYAQEQLGDIVFVELPEPGSKVTAGEPFGVIESVKAVSDLYAPVSGTVADVNGNLEAAPEAVNQDCYEAGWLIAIEGFDESEHGALLDAEAYRHHVDERRE